MAEGWVLLLFVCRIHGEIGGVDRVGELGVEVEL